jgi:hypothetical protein
MMDPALCLVDCRKGVVRSKIGAPPSANRDRGERFAGPVGRKSAEDAIKEIMRKIVLAVVVAVLPAWVAVAQQSNQPRKNPPKSKTLHPPVSGNPCAQYGPGFVKVAGSDMCVKIGGSVSIEAGGSARR